MDRTTAHTELEELLRDFRALHEQLDQDFLTCLLNASDNSQMWRRAAVRCLFAHVEAVAFQLKQLAARGRKLTGTELSLEETLAIKELTIQVKDTGEVFGRALGIPVLSNLRFAFKVFSKVFLPGWSASFSGSGWEAFRSALKVRDRITHPKTVEAIVISAGDFEAIKSAQGWWRNTLNGLFASIGHRPT